MARARNIKPSFFKNEQLVELPFEYRLLFIGLWTLADRDGRIEDRPKRIKMEIFPADSVDVEEGLSALQAEGFIDRYEANGIKVISVINFTKHQSPHHTEKASELPGKAEAKPADPAPEDGETPDGNGEAPDIHESPFVEIALNPDSLIPDSQNPDLLNPELLNPETETPVASESRQRPDENPVLRILGHWKTTMGHPRTALDAKREKAIKTALKWGYSEADICQAITGCSLTPHNMGQNEQGQRYDGLHIILGSADQIDRFMRNAVDPPKPKTQADMRTQANVTAAQQWAAKMGG